MTFYGKNFTADEMAQNIAGHVKKWQEEHPGYSSSSSSSGVGTKWAGRGSLCSIAAVYLVFECLERIWFTCFRSSSFMHHLEIVPQSLQSVCPAT